MPESLEDLVRAAAERGVSISVTGVTANDQDGFSGCVFRYGMVGEPGAGDMVNMRDLDPVAALRKALVEHDRRERDRKRRYEAALKAGDGRQGVITDEIDCEIEGLLG